MKQNNGNSVRSHITYSSTLATVKQHLNETYKTKACLFFVEGKYDKMLYERLYSGTYNCICLSGRNSIYPILSNFSHKFGDRFIIIKDADFDNLNNTNRIYANLFITDKHDLKTTFLSDKFFEVLYYNYYKIFYPNVETLKQDLFQALEDILHLSYIKWYANLAPTCGKNRFKVGVKVGCQYQGVNRVPICDWILAIQNIKENEECIICSEDEIIYFEQNYSHNGDILNLVDGHNMLEAFAQKLRKTCKKNISHKDMRNLLINTYPIEEYKTTRMFAEINRWIDCNKHAVKINECS